MIIGPHEVTRANTLIGNQLAKAGSGTGHSPASLIMSSSSSPSQQIQKKLPSFGGQGSAQTQQAASLIQTQQPPSRQHKNPSQGMSPAYKKAPSFGGSGQAQDETKKLYSVVIKEDPAEQFSPTFNARKGFFQFSQASNGVNIHRNSDFQN